MNNMTDGTITCKICRTHLADLFLDESYRMQNPALADHIAECEQCGAELQELRSTFALMDVWTVPEPSAYFDAKLHARLREAQASVPEGIWNRMRSFMLYSTGRSLRPTMAAALGVVLVLGGGGTFAGLYQHPPIEAKTSATVNDLNIMDNNAQALQQMDQLLDPGKDDASAHPAT